jgi:serine/threonine-protein kinase
MSDFLSQFQNKKYKNENENKLDTTSNSNEERIVNNSNSDLNSKNNKEASGIKTDEHEIVIDTSYNKNKTIRYIIVGVVVLIICIMLFITFQIINSVKVLNFVDKDISEAKTWALKNKIELDVQYVFDTNKSINSVISQDVEQNTTVQKGSIITVTVSKGADPDEKITIPDFSVMSTSDVRNWINENKIYNTSVIQEYSDNVELNKFIKKEYRDVAVDDSNFKRKDYLLIYMSKGKETAQKNIEVPDFVNKSKGEVETWANTNEINAIFTESTSNTVAEGCIISQNIAKDTLVSKKDTIQFKVSIGKSIKVPDFNSIAKDSAASSVPELTVKVITKYSDTIQYGNLISQSVKPNTYLSGKNKDVTVIYSEGKPFIDNLVGRSEKDIVQYFYDFNQKGANITYNVKYIDSDKEKGTVVWMSIYSEFVSVTTDIELHVSKGNLTPEPKL